MFLYELSLLAVLAACSLAFGRGRPGRLDRAWGRLARRRGLCCLGVGLLAMAAAASLAWRTRLPLPAIHDEFSYLLAGDTFAHGRLTNPTHPMWRHFETYHVIHRPSYQSKYPPGQGLFLALGQCLGAPIYGVWLSLGLACAATCWMLQGWLGPRWGLMGGILAAANGELLIEWGESYWGGGVAMLGGALLIGAVPRALRRPRISDAVLLGAGCGLLVLTRPLEGFFLALVAAAAYFGGLIFSRRRPGWGAVLLRTILPAATTLAVFLGWLAWYQWAVTGDPLRMPYLQWNSEHADAGTRHPDMARFTGSTPLPLNDRLLRLWVFFFKPLLTVPLLALPWALGARRVWFPLLGLAVIVGWSVAHSRGHAHYVAPIAPLAIWLAAEGLRQLRLRRCQGQARGRWFAAALPIAYLLLNGLYLERRLPTLHKPFALERERQTQELLREGGRHLVIVRYGPRHVPHDEWVYNAADIDRAAVVWARDMGPAENEELLEFFGDRQIWLLEAESERALRRPYPRPGTASPVPARAGNSVESPHSARPSRLGP